MSNQIVKASRILADRVDQLEGILPSIIRADAKQYAQTALAIADDPNLQDCTPVSVVRAIYGAAKVGLSLDKTLGQAYIVPRKEKGVKKAFLTIGYLGWCELAFRSKNIAALHAEVVFSNDEFNERLGSERKIVHRRWDIVGASEAGEPVMAYCTWFDTKSQTFEFHRISKSRVDRARKSSQAAGSDFSPWNTDPMTMWKKTAIIDAHRYWKLTPELALAGEIDEHAEKNEPQTELPEVTGIPDDQPKKSSLADDYGTSPQPPAENKTPATMAPLPNPVPESAARGDISEAEQQPYREPEAPEFPACPDATLSIESFVDLVAGLTGLDMGEAAKRIRLHSLKPWPQMRRETQEAWWKRFANGEIESLKPQTVATH